MDVILRSAEGCGDNPFLLWDSIWDTAAGFADWALAGADETQNSGGLSAKRGLFTAVVLCMFTDKRIAADHPLAYLADGDPRGWWGDGVSDPADPINGDLGSLLWVLERAPLTDEIVRWAKQLTVEALSTLIEQGAASRIDVEATAKKLESRLELVVKIYGRSGERAFDAKFDLLWQQINS